MKRQILIAILKVAAIGGMIFCLSSCSRKITSTSAVLDSTVTEVKNIERDTVLTIGADSISVMLSLEELPVKVSHHESSGMPPALKPIIKKGHRSTVIIEQSGDNLKATCICPEAEIKARLYDKLVTTLHQRKEASVKVVPQKFVPLFVKILAWIGAGALVYTAVRLIIKYYKPF